MNNNNVNTASCLYWVTIKVYEGKYPTSDLKSIYKWSGSWHVRTKWDWYFKYRAALAQVQNPRSLVDFKWGTMEADTRTRRDFIKTSITTKKRMITKLSNELLFHKNWLLSNDIFGLDGDDGRIEKAELKINRYSIELQQLEEELATLSVN